MIEGLSIERAGIEDASEILALQKLAYQSEAALYGDAELPPLKQTLAGMESDLRTQTVLKASVGGQVIGSVRAHTRDGTCFIGRLIVDPDHQGQGLGTLLMQQIESCFPSVHRFELFTGHLSARNLHLYQKLGYRTFREEWISDCLNLSFLEKQQSSVPH
jgi:GNAT superfamily N-acetyltransferase